MRRICLAVVVTVAAAALTGCGRSEAERERRIKQAADNTFTTVGNNLISTAPATKPKP